eukprot:TRINITY_DN16827_c0_g3_i1.p1 TRINITY_DN16827_c0_g3~~TRINITY_DN16827_c0_g3_i1.p1  ORF type:complete len:314 (+),score=88.49 TRINITY_DN16827_c0_g3_i1:120-1061(+)
MGDTLAKPVTDKHSSAMESELLLVGATGMQGWRRGMEDAHTTKLHLRDGEVSGFFGVYDGHCGQATARFCGEHLHEKVVRSPHYDRGDWKAALEQGFLAVDKAIMEDGELRTDGSGCTAVCCMLTRDLRLACGNAGDSRCVLCRGGRPHPLSFDHKPTAESELKRIQEAGCFVTAGRVNGNLALSRAIGDLEFKQNAQLPPERQAITAFPEVTITDITAEDEFLILACDGIWDVLTNEEAVHFVRERLRSSPPAEHDATVLAQICEDMCDRCIAQQAPGLGCDNMTVMVIQFTDKLRQRTAQRAPRLTAQETE